jgi:hypothetical protein
LTEPKRFGIVLYMDTETLSTYTKSVTVMYRCCKQCEARQGHKVSRRVTFKVREHKGFPDKFGYSRTNSLDYLSPEGEIFSRYLPHQVPFIPCTLCNRPMAGKRLEGQVNTSVPCDARCTGAVGHTCECSCGGANHGIDHQ